VNATDPSHCEDCRNTALINRLSDALATATTRNGELRQSLQNCVWEMEGAGGSDAMVIAQARKLLGEK
jgi:hypothetical protein